MKKNDAGEFARLLPDWVPGAEVLHAKPFFTKFQWFLLLLLWSNRLLIGITLAAIWGILYFINDINSAVIFEIVTEPIIIMQIIGMPLLLSFTFNKKEVTFLKLYTGLYNSDNSVGDLGPLIDGAKEKWRAEIRKKFIKEIYGKNPELKRKIDFGLAHIVFFDVAINDANNVYVPVILEFDKKIEFTEEELMGLAAEKLSGSILASRVFHFELHIKERKGGNENENN